MRYVFKILALSSEPSTAISYIAKAFGDVGEDKATYSEWYSEINVLDDICDLELNVITDVLNTDFEETIASIDGIVYFLNPLRKGESDFFEMILPILYSVKRDIPTVIVFYDEMGYLPVAVNNLFDDVWTNYPDLEAFINIFPSEFHQVLQCLCIAMITGDTPLNIENAWMRFPVYIKLANHYFHNQNLFYAAQALKKMALIANIYEKQEYFIYSEQAAYLYAKLNLFLEASNILEDIDERKSKDFKKMYVNAIIREGNILFNKNKFENAALQYESAGQWASIELKDREIITQSFKLAINSWISACKCEKSFLILERLPHEEIAPILNEIVDKINAAADYLMSTGNLNSAREQLYYSVNTYQREGLSETVKKLTQKLTVVLITIFKNSIKNQEIYHAKSIYDEIENMWESFKVKEVDLDSSLDELIRLFLDKLNFSMATILINKLNSYELKKELTEYSSKVEDGNKELLKKEHDSVIHKGIEILKGFISAEREIVAKINTEKIEQANLLVDQKDWLQAAEHIKTQAEFLKEIGKEEIENQILTKSLDILLDGKEFDPFFHYYQSLTVEMKINYLTRSFPVIIEKLKDIKETESFENCMKVFENFNGIYRDLELYKQSKQISEFYIDVIKKETFRIVENQQDLAGVNRAVELIKTISFITSSYLDNVGVDLDEIYGKITEIYLYQIGDLSSAHAYNDKIEKKSLKKELHKKIARIEASKSAIAAAAAKDSLRGEILVEKLSIIKQRARDAFHDRDSELKQRRGYKRVYFKEALDFIKNNEFEKAVEKYKESIIKLNKIKKYNLAGVSLAIACLLLMKENKIQEMVTLLEDKELVSSEKSFFDTFPVTLIEYIIDIQKLQDDLKLNQALSFLENLPLFEEEMEGLYVYLGKEYRKEDKTEKSSKEIVNISNLIKKINELGRNIQKEKSDVSRRKLMKKQYWDKALNELEQNNLINASLAYLDVVPLLAEKDFNKLAAIGLILGSLSLVKEKNVKISKNTFDKNLKDLKEDNQEKIEALPEVQLMEHVFNALESNEVGLLELSLNSLAEKLILFEPEIFFLKSFLEEESGEKGQKEALTRKERAELSKHVVELDQTFDTLQQKLRDEQTDLKKFYAKRKAMRRHYYEEVLDLLTKQSFKEAGVKYLELASTISKRKDFKTSSFLVLLYGLSAIKAGQPLSDIESSVHGFLDSLGLSKTVVKDTFEIILILFIIQVVKNNLDQFILKLKEMMDKLALFEEERILIEF